MHRADLHIHTIASGDSNLQPEEIFRSARAGGSDSHGDVILSTRRYIGVMACDWDEVRRKLEKNK